VERNQYHRIFVGEKKMKTQTITLEKGKITGYWIDLGKAPLILLQAEKGYVMCGYLNMAVANKLGVIAGRVTGVKTFDDALRAPIVEASENAKKAGLHEGMNATEFLSYLF
jgi:uncharacterized protein YunC (DUF1805 family)